MTSNRALHIDTQSASRSCTQVRTGSTVYDLLGSFRLPAGDWHAYYAGLEAPLRSAISQWGERDVYTAIRREQQIYQTCGNDYGYLCLVLQAKADSPVAAQPGAAGDAASRRG